MFFGGLFYENKSRIVSFLYKNPGKHTFAARNAIENIDVEHSWLGKA